MLIESLILIKMHLVCIATLIHLLPAALFHQHIAALPINPVLFFQEILTPHVMSIVSLTCRVWPVSSWGVISFEGWRAYRFINCFLY